MAETARHVCVVCDKEYKYGSGLNIHQRRKHGASYECTNPHRNLFCPLCSCPFASKKLLENHFEADHGYNLEKEFLEFSDETQFLQWKDMIEKETLVSFYKRCGAKMTKGLKIQYFHCYRSGQFKERELRKRKLKSIGSNKINGICPAMMKVAFTGDSVKVVFSKTHIGHEMDDEMKRLRLTKEEKQMIAEKLVNKIPIQVILDSFRNMKSEKKTRINFLKRRDILNIKKEFKIDYDTSCSNDVSSDDIQDCDEDMPNDTSSDNFQECENIIIKNEFCHEQETSSEEQFSQKNIKAFSTEVISETVQEKTIFSQPSADAIIEHLVMYPIETNEKSPVIYYKPQGIIDNSYPNLGKDDFLLIILNDTPK